MKTAILSIMLLFPASSFAQTHIPSLTVAGNTITIDADLAWFVEPRPAGVTSPSTVTAFFFASPDGKSPIVINNVPAGTYAIRAFGFPDDPANPQRAAADLSATIGAASRMEEISAVYRKFFDARNALHEAMAEITRLAPTKEETAAVFAP